MPKRIAIEDQALLRMEVAIQQLILAEKPRKAHERWRNERQDTESESKSTKEWERHEEVPDPGVVDEREYWTGILARAIDVKATHSTSTGIERTGSRP